MSGIARLRSTVLDCPEPLRLAEFYAALVGWQVTAAEDDWVVVSDGGRHPRLCFQQVEHYQPPLWPSAQRPQQSHIDVSVDDLDTAEAQVLAIGAVKHEYQPSGEVCRSDAPMATVLLIAAMLRFPCRRRRVSAVEEPCIERRFSVAEGIEGSAQRLGLGASG